MSGLRKLDRREFLEGMAAAGGLALGFSLLPGCSQLGRDFPGAPPGHLMPSFFFSIAPDGAVTIVCHRSEMGQQVRTSMAQIVAEELDASWNRVTVVQAEGDARYGDQNTDGSRSVRRNFKKLREAGASGRAMLLQAAADRWNVPLPECSTRAHVVIHDPTGRSLDYGALTTAAAGLAIPGSRKLQLKKRSEWRIIGQSIPSVDTPAIVRGEGTFGIDVQLEGMKVAVIARPPVLFGRPTSIDSTQALAVSGVEQIIEMPAATAPAGYEPLGGVAVIASNTWAAIQGRRVLKIEWAPGANGSYDSARYRKTLEETARRACEVVREQGDVDAALETASRTLRAEYYVPHLAQAPMEPPVATARWVGGRVEIWASTQTPQRTRQEVADFLGVDDSKVRVYVTLLGGGFGRKSKPDFSLEAAWLSRESGAPIKVVWTREDDLANGYLHAVSAQSIEAALAGDGRPTAWLHRSVFPPIESTFDVDEKRGSSGEMSLGFIDNPFDIPNLRLENGEADAHVRIGWLRSVANVYHAFAIQSFACELAHAAGRDPKDYLLELIGPARKIDLSRSGADYENYGDPLEIYPIDTGRLAEVIRIAADRARWGRTLPKGRGLGIAAHRSFLSYVATVVEVEVSKKGALSIPAVWIAIDAGTVVNPDHVRAQCEGGSVYGLSCALDAEITATAGAIDQRNFDSYRVARMSQAPRIIDVHIVESDEPPGGVGEPPTPPFAPALCNAIFAATGRRIRSLPIGDQLRAPEARHAMRSGRSHGAE